MVQYNKYRIMIKIQNVSYSYDGSRQIIRDMDLELREGGIYGLLGLNGTGKTTLIHLLAGMVFPKKGKILLDGKDIRNREADTLQKLFLIPSDIIFPNTNLEKFVRLNSVFYPDYDRKVLEDCLGIFGIGDICKTGNLQKLSSGEKHKVMASIAVSFKTKVLLMDEPFNGMDLPSRSAFRKILTKHLGDNQTALISTHIVQDISSLLTDIIILKGDGSATGSSIDDICDRYSFGIQSSEAGALYAEPCAEGYRTIRKKTDGDNTAFNLETLFNAITKGVLK